MSTTATITSASATTNVVHVFVNVTSNKADTASPAASFKRFDILLLSQRLTSIAA